ncbi:MAG: hypothetical protein QOE69_3214 [Thermoleophilaceae bacterium]|nr:hypothetical protein [Thermoleophilaceae bacterium]
MTRSDAEARARQLQEEHPDRATHHFLARARDDGEWEVASVEIPEQMRRGKLTETIESRPKPPNAEDPRTGHERRAPGFPGGVAG